MEKKLKDLFGKYPKTSIAVIYTVGAAFGLGIHFLTLWIN